MPVLKIKCFDVIEVKISTSDKMAKWRVQLRSENRNKSLNFLPILKNKVSLFLLLHAPWDETK